MAEVHAGDSTGPGVVKGTQLVVTPLLVSAARVAMIESNCNLLLMEEEWDEERKVAVRSSGNPQTRSRGDPA